MSFESLVTDMSSVPVNFGSPLKARQAGLPGSANKVKLEKDKSGSSSRSDKSEINDDVEKICIDTIDTIDTIEILAQPPTILEQLKKIQGLCFCGTPIESTAPKRHRSHKTTCSDLIIAIEKHSKYNWNCVTITNKSKEKFVVTLRQEEGSILKAHLLESKSHVKMNAN